MERQIGQELSTEKWKTFNRYSDLLAERNSAALDYAFFVGYQCAFRFLMLGLAPVTGDFLRGEEPPEDTPAQAVLPEAESADHEDKIYTHDEAALIVEMFEDILDAHNIKIPSPEDDEREADNEAKLYGSVYSGLLDMVENSIIDLLSRSKRGAAVVENVFSGNT